MTNAPKNPREDFFTGIKEMLTQFSQADLERMKSIIYNEIFARRKSKHDEQKKIIEIPGFIGRK